MNIGPDTIAEIAIAVICGLAVVGFTILQIALRGIEKQSENTNKLINEKFQWAETQRQESRQHWDNQFSELKQSDASMSQRIHSLESRVTNVELHVFKQQITLDKQ